MDFCRLGVITSFDDRTQGEAAAVGLH
jgi:hypothetical protein